MERSERIKKAYEYLRFQGLAGTQEEVAKKMNRQRTNVSSALNGKERYLTDSFVRDFCQTFGTINPDWLLNGDGSMLLAGDTTQSGDGNSVVASEDVPAKSYTRGKPYYNVDFIGGFDLVLNDQTINPDYLIDFKKYEEADYWCNITGHSMEPLISNGDIIALKQLNGWRDFLLYGEVYGVVTDEMRTVKIVTKSEKGDDYLQLVPVNKSPEYQPQDIPVRLITHVLQVLGCMKKL